MPGTDPIDHARSSHPKKKGMQRAVQVLTKEPAPLHPALIPGIGVSEDGPRFSINWPVLIATGVVVISIIVCGLIAPDLLANASNTAVHWVSTNAGWFFSLLTVTVFVFMLIVGYSRKGNIRLGADDEKPEFSTLSWITMLFSAGMGIGLLFFGAYEPLAFFLDTPPGFDFEPQSYDAARAALAQTLLHWGPLAWSYYALVGGAIAYVTYRRGRPGLISAILDPIFSEKTRGLFGPVVDGFAILVTLFGTAVSLGLGALQIARGVEIVSGIGPLGNGVVIGLMVAVTVLFLASAVSGIKRGIRLLSNINMMLVAIFCVFVFIAGPTVFLLNIIPSSALTFFADIGSMLSISGASGPEAADFLEAWTTYYWAWWVSWTPFVGMFIAKISRGRSLREFVTVTILVPSLVCLVWFGTVGGTAIWMEMNGAGISAAPTSQDVLFQVLTNLPWPLVTGVIVIISLVVFFVTSADSASLVMASITERGRPRPTKTLTIGWGVSLSLIAITLLLAGGEDSLSALQALVTVSALPFAVILVLLMVAWWKDLSRDPFILRQQYARIAITEGVRIGIQEHGDDFVFSAAESDPDQGAGAWLDSDDPELTQWYEDALEERENAADDATEK
ncbi:BCCT family transporter [Actinomycetaceae bacterium WB03_NA08]|uniref:BCCT family transporter n=1 Tax=Scrofimicrobium canadense TaxID=2652290 RepID=A0A6N7W7Q2_9ACTO|nr:BCCT family transporter [Scrofimicrobium canadense]MSS85275.1 BCCT family transporter [Scrofimicrobium canadense]